VAWSARSSHSRKREPDPSLTGLLVFGESAFTRPRPPGGAPLQLD